jgi:hypothetical protein
MNELVDDPTGKFFSQYHTIDSDKLAELESKMKPKNKAKVKLIGIESILGDAD